MGHPAVKEACVVGIAHPKWQERPLAAVVLKDGARATAEQLRAFLAESFAKWQLPDAFVFLDAIPRTSVGKFKKIALREQRSEEHTSELQSRLHLVCRLLLEKKNKCREDSHARGQTNPQSKTQPPTQKTSEYFSTSSSTQHSHFRHQTPTNAQQYNSHHPPAS